MQNFFSEKRPHNGLTYEEYYAELKSKSGLTDYSTYPKEEHEHLKITKINFQRVNRIHKTFSASRELTEVVTKIKEPQLWMVISEDWCSDSAQIIPYFAEIAKLNTNINLRILPRDKNLDIMDQYQTNGTRGIPKLAVFDLDGNELCKWGPRPKAAVELIAKLKAEGKTKEEFLEQLHLWYGRNRGIEIQKELLELIKSTLSGVTKRKA
ncbi:MAG: hypothetical protein FD143_2788 [Ignavibacteria bacterium]|nr:MAG: hypothetical protein FD143_2788 [Ignavibacteria bacterium]KAF0158306.1 MAG: hypothetical protein FD188_2564 [Ignavibacteria bacterium]